MRLIPGLTRRCVVACLAVALCSALPLATHAAPLSVTFIHINDWDRMGGDDGRGGAARIAAAVKAERARAEAAGGLAVVTFGGDMISPSVMSGIDRGAHMIDLANAVGFDLAVPGNHEFDFGPEVLRERLAESDAVWLAGNIDYRGRRSFPGTRATTMIEMAGYRLGFLGLLTPDTVEISAAGETVAFLPQAGIAATLAAELEAAGADLVIALTHNRTAEDMDLLRRVRDIDIVLGGHDHELTAWYDGRQALLKSAPQGRYVGILRLTLDRIEALPGGNSPDANAVSGAGDRSRVTWVPSYDLRSTAGVEPDPDVAAMVADYEAQLDRELGQVIGRTETELDTRGPVVRRGEATFGNLLADALIAATGADIAITNGGGIRGGRVYPPGSELTPRMLISELPFGKATVVLALTGAQLREALENSVSRAEENDGRFPQVAGVRFAFDTRRPPGSRITRIEIGGAEIGGAEVGGVEVGGAGVGGAGIGGAGIGGAGVGGAGIGGVERGRAEAEPAPGDTVPLDPTRIYTVATNDFMHTGGDGYTVFQGADVLIDAASGDSMANHLIEYVRAAGTVAPVIEGRIIRED